MFFCSRQCSALAPANKISGLLGLKKSVANGWLNEDFIELHEQFLSNNPNSPSSKYMNLSKENCEANSVRSITYKGDHKKFYFEVLGDTKKQDGSDLTHVLYLPDDIALPSIGREPFKGFNIIQADHLGVGCNYIGEKTSDTEAISTIESAKRYVQLLKELDLQGNYIIYGRSYGSVLGAILTHLVEKEPNLKPPKALILEGVVNAPVSIQKYYESHFKILS